MEQNWVKQEEINQPQIKQEEMLMLACHIETIFGWFCAVLSASGFL